MKKISILLLTALLFATCEDNGGSEVTNVNVTITLPNEIHNGEEFEVIVQPEQAIPIKEAVLYFNDVQVATSTDIVAKFKSTPKDLQPGTYIITCKYKPIENLYKMEGSATTKLVLRIGDPYEGGKIFSLNEDKESGLIAAAKDVEAEGVKIFNWGAKELAGTDLDNGYSNTRLMAQKAESKNQAAYLFKNGYNYEGYNDWYIPSINELLTLQLNRQYVDALLKETVYWSSSEYDAESAFALIAGSGTENKTIESKTLEKYKIRPIRKF